MKRKESGELALCKSTQHYRFHLALELQMPEHSPPSQDEKKIKPSQTARMDSCSSNLVSRRQVRKERTNCEHRNNRHFTSSQTLNWCLKPSAILNREHASTASSGSVLGARFCSDWRVPGAGSCLIHI